MALTLEPFAESHSEPVRAFNRRLATAGSSFQFPEGPVPAWLPPTPGVSVRQEYFVVREDSQVRGGYILKPQLFQVGDTVRTVADYRLPISEGIVDGKYAMVGMLTLKDALRRQPLLYGLGMGSPREPVARMLQIFKWRMVPCPFFFFAVRPARFLRGIAFLRLTPLRRILLDLLATSGLGWLALRLAQWRESRGGSAASCSWTVEEQFSTWCDDLWERSKPAYSLAAVRTREVLDALYPAEGGRFLRLKVIEAGTAVGWAVVLDTPMQDHRQFGDLRVGSVVDCLALPGREQAVVSTATRFLEERGVDLVVTNQLHRDWCAAFQANGFLSGPSNFYFAVCPALATLLAPFDPNLERVHMTRGDGDGPINL
jgi:hypothetical protein